VAMLGVQAVSFFFFDKIHIHIRMTFTFLLNGVITILMGLIPVLLVNEDSSYYVQLALTFIFGSSVAIL
jgi:hypothetical protein